MSYIRHPAAAPGALTTREYGKTGPCLEAVVFLLPPRDWYRETSLRPVNDRLRQPAVWACRQ